MYKRQIQLRTDPGDRRRKQIFVLPKGKQCHDLMHRIIQENESRIVADFTPAEQAQFAQLLRRAIINMGGNPRSPKEEPNK